MVARSDSKFPWVPLIILLIGAVVFWIVPQFQLKQDFRIAKTEASK